MGKYTIRSKEIVKNLLLPSDTSIGSFKTKISNNFPDAGKFDLYVNGFHISDAYNDLSLNDFNYLNLKNNVFQLNVQEIILSDSRVGR